MDDERCNDCEAALYEGICFECSTSDWGNEEEPMPGSDSLEYV